MLKTKPDLYFIVLYQEQRANGVNLNLIAEGVTIGDMFRRESSETSAPRFQRLCSFCKLKISVMGDR